MEPNLWDLSKCLHRTGWKKLWRSLSLPRRFRVLCPWKEPEEAHRVCLAILSVFRYMESPTTFSKDQRQLCKWPLAFRSYFFLIFWVEGHIWSHSKPQLFIYLLAPVAPHFYLEYFTIGTVTQWAVNSAWSIVYTWYWISELIYLNLQHF